MSLSILVGTFAASFSLFLSLQHTFDSNKGSVKMLVIAFEPSDARSD